MCDLFATILRALFCEFHSRHQLTVLQRSVPRAKLKSADRFLWVLLLRCWSGWQRLLVIVQPRTFVAWHRAGWGLRCRYLVHDRDTTFAALDGVLKTNELHILKTPPDSPYCNAQPLGLPRKNGHRSCVIS